MLLIMFVKKKGYFGKTRVHMTPPFAAATSVLVQL